MQRERNEKAPLMHWASGFCSTLQVDEVLERSCVDMTMGKEVHFLYTFLQHTKLLQHSYSWI